jgi:chromosomal replication initiator protein
VATLWEKCLDCLQDEFPSQEFNRWIKPLQVQYADSKIILLAPNRFVLSWVSERFLARIAELITQFCEMPLPPEIHLEIGSSGTSTNIKPVANNTTQAAKQRLIFQTIKAILIQIIHSIIL